jgi:glucose-6-phosphate isomerase
MQADAWRALHSHADDLAGSDLRSLFASDRQRGRRFAVEACGLHLDLSKQRITGDTIALLTALADSMQVRTYLNAMFAGERVNETENRPALHTALRLPAHKRLLVNGKEVVAKVQSTLETMAALAEAVRDERFLGATGRPVRNLVHIGIGGSVLGPAMATTALDHLAHPGLTVRYVANVDPTALVGALVGLDPAETLLVVVSKTFTTTETMANADVAVAWLTGALGATAVDRQVIGVTSAPERARSFGLAETNIFDLPDWVGGRFSLPSAAGLSTMVAIGADAHSQLLAGMHAMDVHVEQAPADDNLALLHGLVAVWNRSVLGMASTAVVPYASALARFPAFLQQLAMESNGKSVTTTGDSVPVATGPVVWGEPGTDAQHSFFQLLHQGTTPVPVEFIVTNRAVRGPQHLQDLLVANAVAQSAALAFGRTADEERDAGTPEHLIAHRTLPGNRPNTTVMMDELSPARLGALVALHEHSVVVQAAVWGTNPFDQWGVERGKVLAADLAPRLGSDSPDSGGHGSGDDSSTAALVDRHRRATGRAGAGADAV